MNAESNPEYRNLLANLFSGPQRWGWQFLPLPTPLPSPLRNSQPQRQGIGRPDLRKQYARIDRFRNSGKVLRGLILLFLLGLTAASPVFLVIALAFVAFWFGPVIMAKSSIASADRQQQAEQLEQDRRLQQATQEWSAQVASFEQEQLRLQGTADLWYPVAPPADRSRVDVFGGVPRGLAALMATFGCGVLTAGASILVLDLSGEAVASGLAKLASDHGEPVRAWSLQEDATRLDLLGDIPAADLADLLLDAARDPGTERDELRSHDVELVRTVIDRLDSPVTFTKLAEGMDVLRRIAEPGKGPLSSTEFQRINKAVDLVGTDPQVRDKLTNLRTKFGSLSDLGADPVAETINLWQPGVTVLSVDGGTFDRRDRFVKRFAFTWLAYQIASRNRPSWSGWVVVSAPDQMGRDSLESLAIAAARAGVKLMYQFQHLREDTDKLLGGADSATVFMRLGNPGEAESAARHIGRGHRFVLNSLTSTKGTQVGSSTSATDGGSQSESVNLGYGPGGRSSSRGQSYAENWSRTVANSRSQSESEAVTHQRSYDYSVEPTVLQGLPPTAFLLVDEETSSRAAIAGDCNPGICLVDKLAAQPATVRQREERQVLPGTEPEAVTAPTPRPLPTVRVADPSGQFEPLIPNLQRAGYDVHYISDPKTILSGWSVSDPSGAEVDPDKIMRILRPNQ